MKDVKEYTDIELKAIGYDLVAQGEKIQADLRTIAVELERRSKEVQVAQNAAPEIKEGA